MFNLRKYYLFIISIIISISFMVSCSKATDPSYESSLTGGINTTTNANINNNIMTVWCGPVKHTISVSEENLRKIWRNSFFDRTIYSSSAMTSITGRTDTNGNYYDSRSPTTIRTSFRGVGLTTYQGRITVCGIYYDETYGFGNRWRKIIVTPEYVEQAAYGSANITTNSDGSLQSPPANFFFDTGFVWYNFIFGVMEH